jgi:hypothetical protein
MAKWTKHNNPHTWSGRKMAKSATRTQIIRYAPPRQSAPIVIRTRSAPVKHKKHHRRHGGSGSGVTQQRLINVAIGGAAYGFIEKMLPPTMTLPVVGRAGTIAIGAFYFGKGRAGIVSDVALAAAVIAGYQMGSTGKISGADVMGDVDGPVPQIGGLAAQV